MSTEEDLESVIERCRENLRKDRSSVHIGLSYISRDEVAVKREDLTTLIAAATWRMGYLQGRSGR